MPTIAELNAARKQKMAAEAALREQQRAAGRLHIQKRHSAPLKQARRPLSDCANRRHSAPPMPPPPTPLPRQHPALIALSSKESLKRDDRKPAVPYTYDSMPTDLRYARPRDYSGASAEKQQEAAVGSLGHAYVDAGVVAKGIQSLSNEKCEHCGQRAAVVAVGGTRRSIGGGSLDFKCGSCYETRRVPLSSKVGRHDEATMRFVAAATTEGMGLAATNRLATKLDIGMVNKQVHARVVDKVEGAAAAEFDLVSDAALKREIAATLLMEGDSCLNSNGKVMITIISDGTWQKRYGRNSLVGFVGVYGLYTGECLYAGSKVARCATCRFYKKEGRPAKAHACTRTWNEAPNRDGATSNMEKVITLEAVEALYQKGAIVGTLVTDGDTKTLSYIKAHGPKEVAGEIEGSQDLGHLAKNLKKRLYELNLSGSLKGLIPAAEQERLRKLFCNAVHEHRRGHEGGSEESDAAALQKKLRAIAPHQFKFGGGGVGEYDHQLCGSWCKLKKANADIYDPSHIPGGRKSFLDQRSRAAVVEIFENYSTLELCSRLLLDCSTNVAESTNSMLWLRYLHKTFLRPRQSALAWNLAQLQKAQGAVASGVAVMERAGLPSLQQTAQRAAAVLDGQDKK